VKQTGTTKRSSYGKEENMAYNARTDIFTCKHCGQETGKMGLMRAGAGEDGDHLSPFSCIDYLRGKLTVVEIEFWRRTDIL
jgi:hypothetical protein